MRGVTTGIVFMDPGLARRAMRDDGAAGFRDGATPPDEG